MSGRGPTLSQSDREQISIRDEIKGGGLGFLERERERAKKREGGDDKQTPEEDVPMTMDQIKQWQPELESILTALNQANANYMNYITETYRKLRPKEQYNNNGDVISIFDSKMHRNVKRMVCNLCNEYQFIANAKEPPVCEMAHNFGGRQFELLEMQDHFENMAHKEVQRYILMMQYKDRLLAHEFGGSDHIIKQLRSLIEKLTSSGGVKRLKLKGNKPPLYPFEKSSLTKVTLRLGYQLAFSVNQNEFVSDIIYQSMKASDHASNERSIVPTHITYQSMNDPIIATNIEDIPAVLSDLPFVNKSLQVISIVRPIIMKRLFQALITNNKNKKNDTEHIRGIFMSALKTTKSNILGDIQKLHQLQSMDKNGYLTLFENGLNNINIDSWKYRNIDLSLLFDVYSVYRIEQYVKKGKFDTSIADLRQRCGAVVDNNISIDEATVFQKAIRYYINNIVQPLKLSKSCLINGDCVEYITYIFAVSSYLKQSLTSIDTQYQSDIGGIQFDLVLIAHSTVNIFDGQRLRNETIQSLDIESNLTKCKIKFAKQEISDENSKDRFEITKAVKNAFSDLNVSHINAELNNKRFVILIDKRRVNNETLYVFESMSFVEREEKSNNIGLYTDGVMHYLTQLYLLPNNDNQPWIGAREAMNGYLLTYSFHIHSYDIYRCYLHFNGGCTRTFPEHFVELIPKYFVFPHVDKLKKDFKKEFIKTLYSHEYKHGFDLMLTDAMFTNYYRLFTGLYHISVNYRRVRVEEQKEITAAKNSKSTIDVLVPQKKLTDLDKEEFCFILIWHLKQNKIAFDTMKLKQLSITDLQLDGTAFSKISRKNFGKGLKKLKIAGGKAAKIFKQMKEELNVEKIKKILKDYTPVSKTQNSVTKTEEKSQASTEEQKSELGTDANNGIKEKEMSELSIEEMFGVILHCMDALKMETDLSQLSNLLKNELKLSGEAFKKIGRKAFGTKLKTIRIKAGSAAKLFKIVNALSHQELNDILRANNKNESEIGTEDKKDTFSKPLESLTCDELNFVIFEIITSDDRLNSANIDLDKMKQITIAQGLDGTKFKQIKRKDFGKLYRGSGIKGGHSSKIFKRISEIKADQIGLYLAAQQKERDIESQKLESIEERKEDKLEKAQQKKDSGDIEETQLETLNIERFTHLFVCVLKDIVKDEFKTNEKLEQFKQVIIDQKIDGKFCKSTKSTKFAKLFRPIGIKGGPMSKVHKKIVHLDPNEIGKKLLISPECNGKLEECPNIEELCKILVQFHNKSVSELLSIKMDISETLRIMNNYTHLTSKHQLFGSDSENEDLGPQHHIYTLISNRIGPCKVEGNKCYFIMRHSRDIELSENAAKHCHENNGVVLDQIASIHTYIFHSMEDQLYRLFDRQAVEEGVYKDNIKNIGDALSLNKDSQHKPNPSDLANDMQQRRRRDYLNNGFAIHSSDAPNARSSPLDGDSDSGEEREEGVTVDSNKERQRIRRNDCDRFSTPVEKPIKEKKKLSVIFSEKIEKIEQKSMDISVINKPKKMSSKFKLQFDGKDININKQALSSHHLQHSSSKFSTQMMKNKNSKLKEEIYAINFGEPLDDWFSPLECPVFMNVCEEVTLNDYEKIFDETYTEIYKKCELLVKTQANDAMLFSLQELIAIKLYTDCDKLQSRFRRTFWSGTPKKQRRSFIHWALMLQKTICYGAVPITFDVFHGLSNLFTVKKMLPIFHGPISTTTSANVATKFADTKGMLWRIQPRIWSELENPIGIKVHWMSRFEYEKEVLLMNCPLPIRKTKAFETGIHKKIEYLLDYLAKYNEPIIDKKKFYTQVGLNKLVSDKFMGSELERLWLTDLGQSTNLWKQSKRSVPQSKLLQWMNERETLNVQYWEAYVKLQVVNAKHTFFRKMQKIQEQTPEDQKVYCYGMVVAKIFEEQARIYSQHLRLDRKALVKTNDPRQQTRLQNQIRNSERSLKLGILEKRGSRQILSLLRGLPLDQISETDTALRLFRDKTKSQIYNFLTETISTDTESFHKLKLQYSVYYRLVNELDMFYLPFAAFTRVIYNGPFITKDEKSSFGSNATSDYHKLYQKKHATTSNLFEYGRYATIVHLEEGIPLLQEMCTKHKIKYRLQFRFRPDKQQNLMHTEVNYKALKTKFKLLNLNGTAFNLIKYEEFELISLSVQLSKIANIIPSEIMKVFEEITETQSEQHITELSYESLFDTVQQLMQRNEKEREQRKERRKSDKYAWQFVDISVEKIKREMIFLNIAGCANYEVLNGENIWNYKLMCCVLDEDPDKWICVDKGRYHIDLDCVVPADTHIKISSFNCMAKSRNKMKNFHRNVWIFKSLHLGENSTLEIEPFGFDFLHKKNQFKAREESKENDLADEDYYEDYYDEKELQAIGDNQHFQLGSIRIFAYDSITIEKGAQITVSGKGMYGSPLTEKINLGRGGHVQWTNAKDKKNKNDRNFNVAGSVDLFSGGGYATMGGPVIDQSKSGWYQIERGNDNNAKDASIILCGGDVFGDPELDTLYYGSSGGKGCIEANKNNCYVASDRGGGIIELIAQRIINRGRILANGKVGRPGGQWFSAGSGGSIKIKCKEFENKGVIEAMGGQLPASANKNVIGYDKNGNVELDQSYQPLHGNGGDGRIAIYTDKHLSPKQHLFVTKDYSHCKPKPYVNVTAECNKSTLPQWKLV